MCTMDDAQSSSSIDDGIHKVESSSDLTDLTSLPSDHDSSCDALDAISESQSASIQSSQHQDDEAGRKKSVRFSIVHTREYEVIEEPADPDEQDELDDVPFRRRSLGWEYTEKESNIETHISDSQKERKEKYLDMIREHIERSESEREERERAREVAAKLKKRGFRGKVLKPLWKGFVEAASRSAVL
eukprot:149388_1